MALKVMGAEVVLATVRGSWAVAATRTDPKSSALGVRVSSDGVAVPKRLMKSSEELASERSCSAAMRVPEAWGVKVTASSQLAAGTSVEQVEVTVKSGVVMGAARWRVVVPVLLRVMVWGALALPTAVAEKVREFWEAV